MVKSDSKNENVKNLGFIINGLILKIGNECLRVCSFSRIFNEKELMTSEQT